MITGWKPHLIEIDSVSLTKAIIFIDLAPIIPNFVKKPFGYFKKIINFLNSETILENEKSFIDWYMDILYKQ
jgi:hypothetical protein